MFNPINHKRTCNYVPSVPKNSCSKSIMEQYISVHPVSFKWRVVLFKSFKMNKLFKIFNPITIIYVSDPLIAWSAVCSLNKEGVPQWPGYVHLCCQERGGEILCSCLSAGQCSIHQPVSHSAVSCISYFNMPRKNI